MKRNQYVEAAHLPQQRLHDRRKAVVPGKRENTRRRAVRKQQDHGFDARLELLHVAEAAVKEGVGAPLLLLLPDLFPRGRQRGLGVTREET